MTDDEIHKMCEKYEICDYGIVDGKVNIDLTDMTTVNMNFMELLVIPVPFGEVYGVFSCDDNELETLQNSPTIVRGDFYCNRNRLTTLWGGPRQTCSFYSGMNSLTTLEHGPIEVHGNYDCNHNHLTDLRGCPEEVCGNFRCSHNRLTVLDGGPNDVYGNFECTHNPQLPPEEIIRWYYNSTLGGDVHSDYLWLDKFLNCKQKDHTWTSDYGMLLRKYCND